MADRIKGITIELDGETTGLKKALSGVTSQSISIQKELTDVNRLLKFDPGNTQALAQKQELLSKQIENTSQKLKALKEAESQVEEQFKSGKIGEDQYRSFQREIEFTEASLGKFKTALEESSDPKPLEELNQEAEKSKGIFDNMGEYIKRGIGMAIGGDIWDKTKEGIGELVTFGGDWQKSLNTLQAQTGATSEEMDSLNKAMTNIYGNNFGSSMEDVAESIMQVRTYLQGTGEDIEAATQNAIAFRDTFGVEVSESMRSVTTLMSQFGITSEEAFNLLAQGQHQNLNFSDELYDSINEYSVQFKKLGLDAEDMFNIFNDGAIDGAFNIDKIGDAVKEFSIRAIDGSDTTIDGFTKLGLNADEIAKKFSAGGDTAKEAFTKVTEALANVDDPIEQSTIGIELFGTQFEDLGPKVITQLGNIGDNFNKTIDTMNQINQVKYNTPIEALQGLGRQIQTSILLPMSQELMPTINDMSKNLAGAFTGSDIKSGIESLSQGLGKLIKTIANIVTNILPSLIQGLSWIMDNANTIAIGIIAIGTAMEVFKVVSLIQGLVTAFKAAQLATEGLTVSQWLYNAAMTANPIGLVIAAVAGLVAAIVYLWNTNEGFRNAIIGAWETIASVANTVWNGIIAFFTEIIPSALSSVGTFFSGLWITIGQTFSDGWNNIVTFFTESIPAWIESIGVWFLELPNKIAFALGEALGSIIKWGADVINWISTEVPKFIEGIVKFYLELPGKIWTTLVAVVTKLGEWGSNIVSWISNNVPIWINNIVTFFSELPRKIWTFLVNVVTSIGEWGSNMLTTAKEGMGKVVDGIISTFTNLPSKMMDIGKNIVQGIKDGIARAWEGMTGWIGGLCDSFTNGIKDALDIHSPSRVMMELGAYTGEGFGLGIESTVNDISKQANNLADAAIPSINASNYDMGVNYNPIGSNSLGGTASSLDLILAKMDSMTQTIANMQILMDSKMIGKLVTSTVSGNLAFNSGRKGF